LPIYSDQILLNAKDQQVLVVVSWYLRVRY